MAGALLYQRLQLVAQRPGLSRRADIVGKEYDVAYLALPDALRVLARELDTLKSGEQMLANGQLIVHCGTAFRLSLVLIIESPSRPVNQG